MRFASRDRCLRPYIPRKTGKVLRRSREMITSTSYSCRSSICPPYAIGQCESLLPFLMRSVSSSAACSKVWWRLYQRFKPVHFARLDGLDTQSHHRYRGLWWTKRHRVDCAWTLRHERTLSVKFRPPFLDSDCFLAICFQNFMCFEEIPYLLSKISNNQNLR